MTARASPWRHCLRRATATRASGCGPAPATLEGSGLSLVSFTGFSGGKLSIAAELLAISASTGELEMLVLTRAKMLKKAGVPGADLAKLPGSVAACTEAEPIAPYRGCRCSL